MGEPSRTEAPRLSRLERWLAPGLLVAIALVQILLAYTRDLPPWKGGGFGMFASIDGLSMREVRCEATTMDGVTIRVDALRAVDLERRDRMRALPSPRALTWLGHVLLEFDFVPETVREEAAEARLRLENPGLEGIPDAGGAERARLYRPLRENDPEDAETVQIRSVKLRWWRISFDRAEAKIRTEPIGEEVTVSLSLPR